jgi:hypothetical protein
MVYWGLRIYWVLNVRRERTTPAIFSALELLFMYPIVFIICWLPNEIMLVFYPSYQASNPSVVAVNSLSILHGGVTAIIFFYKSREFRSNWINLFRTTFNYQAFQSFSDAEDRYSDTISNSIENYSDFADDDYYRGESQDYNARSHSSNITRTLLGSAQAGSKEESFKMLWSDDVECPTEFDS